MKNLSLSLILTGAFTLFSCGANKEQSATDSGYLQNEFGKNSGSDKDALSSPKGSADAAAEETSGGSSIPSAVERKLIKNGEVSFKAKSLPETKSRIQTALASMGGYIAKENAYDYSESPSEELTVRIPAKNFDAFLEAILMGVDEVDSKKIDIEDVTEEFVDKEARLKNKKQLEDKYRELLTKTNNMEDILKIEKEIELIREEIEAVEGRLKYLSNQVNYSTLRITYYEHRTSGFNFGGKLGNAIANGGTGFLWFIIGVVSLWPMWLIVGILWFVIIKLVKRAKAKKQNA